MPEIKYSDNPNEETAFVETDDGQRNRAVLTAAVDGEIEFPANPNSTKVSVTVDGVKRKAIAVATIAGGGDQHNLGYYATQTALEEAHATAEAGDWAIVGATDTVWVWDSDNQEWVDSDQKGQVTSVNNQTGAVTVSEVPSQTGNAGKFLTTDGTDASWENIPVEVNTSKGSVKIASLNALPNTAANIVIGTSARATYGGGNIAIGRYAGASNGSIHLGNSATEGNSSIGILGGVGLNADYAIQLGGGSGVQAVRNSDANTFKVANGNGNYEIMSADGTIPADRLTHAINKYSTMPTAASTNEGWIVQFTGTTDSTYTHGYIYECAVASTTPASATIAQTTGSTLSDLTVNGETFWEELEEYDIPQQTGDYAFTYNGGTGYWDYGDDYFDLSDFGVTYTGTPTDGDVLTISVTAPSATYAWTRVDVQPAPEALPDQTGQSGKFLTTDGTDASWSDKPLVNKANGTDGLAILGTSYNTTNSVVVGKSASTGVVNGSYSVLVGYMASASQNNGVAVGARAATGAVGAIQIGSQNPSSSTTTNSDANTFKVANANGNYEIMSADGTVPADRLTKAINKYSTMPTAASTNEGWIVQYTGATDATYTHGYIYECVSDGGNPATYSWTAVQVQAGGGGSAVPMAAEFTSSTAPSAVATTGQNCSAMAIGPNSVAGNQWAFDTGNIAIGQGARAISSANGGVAIGVNAKTDVTNATVIGNYCVAYGTGPATLLGWGLRTDYGGIMIGADTGLGSSIRGTGGFDVVMYDTNTYESVLFTLLTQAGLIPAARLASTTGLADGNYRLRLTMSNGTPTLSWVAE